MSINLWGWREDGRGAVRLGLSEGVSAEVLDLATAGIASAEALYDTWQEKGHAGIRHLLTRYPERRPLHEPDLVFPVPVSEIWGAGVTYERSRDAREEESEGFDALYRLVYDAPRPEIFFKHPGRRMAQPNEVMGLRDDARWHVPEPELSVVLGPAGEIFGYTGGNDLSARDIEGQNPLYLPQAKMFHKSASLGPSIALADSIDPAALIITCTITRGSDVVFSGRTTTSLIRRPLGELVRALRHAWPLEPWTVLMTGTGIVPPDDVALVDQDVITISVTGIGILTNPVRTITGAWMDAPGPDR